MCVCVQPHHSIGMGKSSVHKRPDSLLQDSNQSSSRLNSILLTITEGDHKVTHIAPENQKDKVKQDFDLLALHETALQF